MTNSSNTSSSKKTKSSSPKRKAMTPNTSAGTKARGVAPKAGGAAPKARGAATAKRAAPAAKAAKKKAPAGPAKAVAPRAAPAPAPLPPGGPTELVPARGPLHVLRMSDDDFRHVAASTQMTEETVMMVRKVLVDGEDQIDVANTHGVIRQTVNNAVNRMRQAFQDQASQLGSSIVEARMNLPVGVAEPLAIFTRALQGKAAPAQRAALNQVRRAIEAATKNLG